MQSIHTLLKLAPLRWTGHVTRMPYERLPNKILYGELQVGKRSHGSQKKWYKDTLKASLKDFNIPTESWEEIVQDRTKWRGLIKRGAGEYEAKRISEAEQKRAQRKARAKASPTELSSSDLSCSICNRQLELRLVSLAILEHTNNNTSHSWSGLVIVSNDRRTSSHSECACLAFSKSICLILKINFPLGLSLTGTNSVGSGETVRMRSLARTFAVRIRYMLFPWHGLFVSQRPIHGRNITRSDKETRVISVKNTYTT